jgi:hypothetical protein
MLNSAHNTADAIATCAMNNTAPTFSYSLRLMLTPLRRIVSSYISKPQTAWTLNHQEKRHYKDSYCNNCNVVQDQASRCFSKALLSGIKD